MFLVDSYAEDEHGNRTRIVGIDRAEEKMGHHGSFTAALHFDRAPAPLIGKRGHGFRYMLLLMNEARLAVGFECIGSPCTAPCRRSSLSVARSCATTARASAPRKGSTCRS